MAKSLKKKLLYRRLKFESNLVRENSMKILKEFEAIDTIENNLALESKNLLDFK